MKILFVSHSGDLCGGSNRILLKVMEHLKIAYGVDVSILLPCGGEMKKACDALGIQVYVARYSQCCTVFRHEFRDLLRVLKLLFVPLLDLFRSVFAVQNLPDDFDLVYTNDRMVIIGAFLAKLLKIPHIWHVRTFGRVNENRFPPFWNSYMEHLSDRIVLISSAMLKEFRSSVATPEKLIMIHDGIDIKQYVVKDRKKHDAFRMLLVGRIVPAKGQMDAIRAIDILKEKYNVAAELYIAGETPKYASDKYEKLLRDEVVRLGIEDRVHFLGEVRDISAVRAEVDVELMCAWCEAFGLVSAEAMCAGLPVIGSASGGTPDIVKNYDTGLLFNPRDAEDLAEKMEWMYSHPIERAAFGKAGIERANAHFSIERCVREMHQVIAEVKASDRYAKKN